VRSAWVTAMEKRFEKRENAQISKALPSIAARRDQNPNCRKSLNPQAL
jgi:hypothetical protein